MSSDSIFSLERGQIERLNDPDILRDGLLELYDDAIRVENVKMRIEALDRDAEITRAVKAERGRIIKIANEQRGLRKYLFNDSEHTPPRRPDAILRSEFIEALETP